MHDSTGKVKYGRRAKGNINIGELAMDGSCMELKNTSSRKDEDIGGCVIKRTSARGDAVFKIPKGTMLKANSSMKIYSHLFADQAKAGELVGDDVKCKTFGMGSGTVVLYSNDTMTTDKCSMSIEYS